MSPCARGACMCTAGGQDQGASRPTGDTEYMAESIFPLSAIGGLAHLLTAIWWMNIHLTVSVDRGFAPGPPSGTGTRNFAPPVRSDDELRRVGALPNANVTSRCVCGAAGVRRISIHTQAALQGRTQ